MSLLGKLRGWFRARAMLAEQAEINRLLTRSGRRMLRDMRHMLDDIRPDSPLRAEWEMRLSMWSDVFWDCRHYRDELHMTIDNQAARIREMEDILEANDLRDPPF